jgi:hypothetical protein
MAEDSALLLAQRETWQKMPAEEQRELLELAHGKGLEVCFLTAVFAATCAYGLKLPWILIGLALLLPVLYQVVITRIWHEVKPQLIARYLVASKTAAKYAEFLHAPERELKLIFRGSARPDIDDFHRDPNDEFAAEHAQEVANEEGKAKDVWISLFPQSLIIFSENTGGAKLEFAGSLINNLSITLEIPEGPEAKESPQILVIESRSNSGERTKWVISSRQQSALIACERKFRFFVQRELARKTEQAATPPQQQVSHAPFAAKRLGANLGIGSNH